LKYGEDSTKGRILAIGKVLTGINKQSHSPSTSQTTAENATTVMRSKTK
jgi:hypothetical protein